MAVDLAASALIASLQNKVESPRFDLVSKYKYLVPDLLEDENDDAPIEKIYILVTARISFLESEIERTSERNSEGRAVLRINPNSVTLSSILRINRETQIAEKVEEAQEAKGMIPLIQPLAEAITSFSMPLISIVAMYVRRN